MFIINIITFITDTVGSSINPLKTITKNDSTWVSKAFMDPERTILRQQKRINRSNKNYQNEIGHPASILNPKLVSTGLKLSYEEDVHNSSISSVVEGMTKLKMHKLFSNSVLLLTFLLYGINLWVSLGFNLTMRLKNIVTAHYE